jgi:phosphodiesterase/alkaline phosphatase D-like protein
VTAPVLTRRQLNRATLARQMLLERVDTSPMDAIRFLVGLQAQEPPDPYVGLWSRLSSFDTADLETLLLDRQVVRLVVQSGTVHAVTADDCLVLRPLAQPILTQQLYSHTGYKGRFDDVDLNDVAGSTSTCPTARSPTRTHPRRFACCPSSTTSCSRTPTAAASPPVATTRRSG